MILRTMLQATLCAAGLAFAAPALAQPGGMSEEVWNEIGCVYNGITQLEDEPYFAIVNAHVTDAQNGPDYEMATAAVTPIVTACADKFGWTMDEIEPVITTGILGTVSDAIEGNYLENGMTEDQLDRIMDVLDEISDEDFEAMATGAWRDSEATQQNVKAQLKLKGVPDDPLMLSDGLYLLEAYLVGAMQLELWLSRDEPQ